MTAVQAIAIGVSTGGTDALCQLIPRLEMARDIPVHVVIHMPEGFTGMLARRIQALSEMSITEAVDGEDATVPGIYISPGNQHLTLSKNSRGDVVVNLNQNPRVRSCRPSVDVLFTSMAEIYGDALIALILTGMGQDGLDGCRVVRERGGRVIAQDEASSVVWGMPGSVVKADLANEVRPLDGIPAAVRRLCGQPAKGGL